MKTILFTKETHLPRFTLTIGEKIKVRADRIDDDGFTYGGGWVESDRYVVIGDN